MIQKFGIELRKLNSVTPKELYRDVDTVLNKFSIPKGGVTIDVQTQTIAHTLNKMLRSEGHLSVCAISECAKISQIVIPVERMEIYNATHCMKWGSMEEDYRSSLIAMVLDDFRTVLNPE
jgi:hypothetical protein